MSSLVGAGRWGGTWGRGFREDPEHIRAANQIIGQRSMASRMSAVPIAPPRLSAVIAKVLDQGQTGGCTFHSISGCVETALAGKTAWAGARALGFTPSPRVGYAFERLLELATKGTPDAALEDVGAYPANGITVVRSIGVTAMGPLAADGRRSDLSPENVNVKPDFDSIESSMETVLFGAHPITSEGDRLIADLQTALAPGNDAPIGLSVPGSASAWQNADGGKVLDAQDFSASDAQDHYVYLYDWKIVDGKIVWRIRNSWSELWGALGDVGVTSDFIIHCTGARYAFDVHLAD